MYALRGPDVQSEVMMAQLLATAATAQQLGGLPLLPHLLACRPPGPPLDLSLPSPGGANKSFKRPRRAKDGQSSCYSCPRTCCMQMQILTVFGGDRNMRQHLPYAPSPAC